ncbi:MAG: chloride channel protein [Clostridia bacterium]|nr:chloride channel protein [Clostridia bacterium]
MEKLTVAKRFIRAYSKKIRHNILLFLKWSAISILTGLTVGGFSTLFAYFMNMVTEYREHNDFILFFLPLAGIVTVFLYSIFKYKNDKGTNLVLSTIHAKSEIPFRMAPLIFVTTILTHLFGGSAGREGAALQLGGSMGNQLGRWLRLDDTDKRVVILCGMSAAFSALFGTPMAAAVFSMEVVSVGIMYYAALVPCVFSSLIAAYFAKFVGIKETDFAVVEFPDLTILNAAETVGLGILCAVISILFILLLHSTGDLFRKYLKNPYIRITVSACVIVGLTFLLGTRDYNGAGMPIIEKAVKGEAVPYAFILKMLFTALTIEAGFRGGEIVPSFFIGATFGCTFGHLIEFSPSVCAAVGLIAVFCGVTNCPITSLLISFELFGSGGIPYFLIAVAVSYFMSGYYGLYHDQKIVYSKYRAKFLNRKAR